MSPIRILGIVLLSVGLVVLFFGWQSTDSLVEEAHEALTGRYTDETVRYFVVGGAAVVAGLLLALFGRKR